MKLEHYHVEVDGADRWDLGKLYVEHSTNHDAYAVARGLRRADRNEVAAVTEQSPIRVLIDGINNSSPCYTIKTTGGKPCGIFGTRDSGYPDSGVVWLLGTDDLVTESKTFIRFSKRWLDELHNHYKLLYNVIDARNEVHLEWLDWMGFEFVKELPRYGVERRKFILFRRYV